MRNRLFGVCTLILITFYSPQLATARKTVRFRAPTSEERRLHALINAYRARRGLPAIGLSRSLTHVAQTHVRDLTAHPPRGGCNMHSWSRHGNWTPCCYTRDHARAACMWKKPQELTNFKGYGFECSYMHSGGATARNALSGWQRSSGHNRVIINQGPWKRMRWRSLGVGIYGKYAVIWFAKERDPDGYWSGGGNDSAENDSMMEK